MFLYYEFRNSNYDPSEIPDSFLPAHIDINAFLPISQIIQNMWKFRGSELSSD